MSKGQKAQELCSAGELPPCQVILNMLPSGLIMVDAFGFLRTWNRAMEQLTGYAAEEVLDGPCTVLGCDSCKTTDIKEAQRLLLRSTWKAQWLPVILKHTMLY